MAAAGWYPDPTGRYEMRWFDGTTWSPSVSRGGQQFHDEVNAAPAVTPPASAPGFGPPPGFGHTTIIPTPTPVESGGSRLGLYVGAGLVAVALAIGGVVLATRSSKDDKGASSTETSIAEGATTPASVDGPSGVASQPVTVSADSLPPFDNSDGDVAVGMPAPVLQGIDSNGEPITIDAASDGPYMIVFLAHWCPHCNREIPRLIEWQQSGAAPAELKIVGVATAVAESGPNFPPDQWLVDKEWPWPAMIDQSQGEGVSGVAADAYGATGWPYFVIVGADGLVKFRGSGEMEIDQIQSMVAAALAS